MTKWEEIVGIRRDTDNILVSDKSADAKLFEVFQLYKEDLKKNESKVR